MKKIFYIIIPIVVFFGFSMMPKGAELNNFESTFYLGYNNSDYIGSNFKTQYMSLADTQYTFFFTLKTVGNDSIRLDEDIAAVIDFCITGGWVNSSPYTNSGGTKSTMYWNDLNRKCPSNSAEDSKLYRMVIKGKYKDVYENVNDGFLSTQFKVTSGPWGSSVKAESITFYYTSDTDFKALEQNQQQTDEQNKTNQNLTDIKNQNTEAENTRKGILGALKSVLSGITNLPGLIWDKLKAGFEAITNGIKGLFDFFKDDSQADLSGLGNSAGWLPAGPIDSLVNLPISLGQNLYDGLAETCQPVVLDLPFVNKELSLPCLSAIYDKIGIKIWVEMIGTIASAFLLYYYFQNLYEWVEDTLLLEESRNRKWGSL